MDSKEEIKEEVAPRLVGDLLKEYNKATIGIMDILFDYGNRIKALEDNKN